MITPNTRLGDLAGARPDLLDQLDRLRMDYCRHGSQSLAEACARVGLSVSSVCTRLAGVRPRPCERVDTDASLMVLCDEIVATLHAFVRASFERLNVLLPRIVAAHGEKHLWLARLAEVGRSLEDDMRDHMIRDAL